MTQLLLTTASKIVSAVAFVALVLAVSFSAEADEFDRIDNWAQKIQKKSRLLIKETVHYRHTPHYAALVDATTHLYDAASHVHQVAHFSNNLNHLQADLADLDQHFHRLEGLFQKTEDLASRGRGHVRNTGYARGLLRSIEKSIDLMRRDVRKAQSKIVSKREVHHAPVPVSRSSNYSDHGGNYGHRHGQLIAPSRVLKPVVVQPKAVPQYRPAYPQHRRSSGFSFSIDSRNSGLKINF